MNGITPNIVSDIEILEDCLLADIEYEEGEDIPLYSDTYVKIYTSDAENLKKELKSKITKLLKSS